MGVAWWEEDAGNGYQDVRNRDSLREYKWGPGSDGGSGENRGGKLRRVVRKEMTSLLIRVSGPTYSEWGERGSGSCRCYLVNLSTEHSK